MKEKKGKNFDYEIIWKKKAIAYRFFNGVVTRFEGVVCRVRSPHGYEHVNFYEGDSPAYAQHVYRVSELSGITVNNVVWNTVAEDKKNVALNALLSYEKAMVDRHIAIVNKHTDNITILNDYISKKEKRCKWQI